MAQGDRPLLGYGRCSPQEELAKYYRCGDTCGANSCAPKDQPSVSTESIEQPCGDDFLPGNRAISDDCYQSSIGVTLQPTVDAARRVIHELGYRAWRVYMVWQKRDRFQRFQEIKRIELTPVKISSLTSVDLELQAVGLDPTGSVQLSEVSPNQVTEADLLGQLDGRALSQDEEFFYELVRIPRCEGEELEVQKLRFTVTTKPYFNEEEHQFEIGLLSQNNPRTLDDQDQTFEPLGPVPRPKMEIIRR